MSLSKFVKSHFLLVSVFITGASVLMLEILAVRILSIHYGNTMFTVSSVLSVILAALSFGYYAGGKLADRHPSTVFFYIVIIFSGLLILLVYIINTKFLPTFSVRFSLISGPLVSSLFLFFVPSLLLGILSPYAIKLFSLESSDEGIGNVSGKVFFFSTFGSIVGSLLAGFVLIPHFGINKIIVFTSLTLFLVGAIPLAIIFVGAKRILILVLAIGISGFSLFATKNKSLGYALYEKDGLYERIKIYDAEYEGRPARFFKQDLTSSGAVFLDTDDPADMVHDYTKYYSLYEVFNPDIKNALIIGGGIYAVPRAMLRELPDVTIDVVEIEPSLYDLAKEYFHLEDDPNLFNFIDDGRRFLNKSNKKYDFIFSDGYYSFFSIPTHFTTREYFTLAKEKLALDGLFVANFIGDLSGDKDSLMLMVIKTFNNAFPNSYYIANNDPESTGVQNIILIGFNSENKIDFKNNEITNHKNPILNSLHKKNLDLSNLDLSSYQILTDDYAPVDYLTAQMLKRNFSEKPLN